MPFPGIKPGSDKEKKIDRCMKKVMAENPGFSKSKAIAICRASIEKREGAMPKTKKGQTGRQRRKTQRKEAAKTPAARQLADDPMADIRAEEQEFDDTTSFDDWELLFDDGEDEDDLLEMASDELGKGVEETDEKCMASEMIDLDPPTDFRELDEEREARKKADEMRTVGWDADRLLRNIVHHPILDPDEKANKIKKVGIDFAERLTNIVQDTKEGSAWVPSEKELELAESEMWCGLVGGIGLIEKLATKAKLTSAARKKLPDSAFACIRDGKRSLPIHDKAHVRNALARLPQMIKRGGESAKIAKCGRAKVQAAAKKMGIGKAGKERKNGILVEKDTAGEYRWIGWVSNNFRDKDKEIISEAAHKEFVGYLDEHPERAPEFWTWHTKGTARLSKADAWLYHEGFVIMSGPLTDIEAYRLMKAISTDDIGMSHGFVAWKDPDDPTIITKYRSYEVSDLPMKYAANPWTTIDAMIKEVSSMSNVKTDYLKLLMGEDRYEGLLEEIEENSKLVSDLGIESKEVDDPEAEAGDSEEETKEEDANELTRKQRKVVKDLFGKEPEEVIGILEAASQAMPVMAERLINLEKQVQGFEETKSDALAEMIGGNAASKAKALASRPSESEDNQLTKEEEEKHKEPSLEEGEDNWFGVPIPKREEDA